MPEETGTRWHHRHRVRVLLSRASSRGKTKEFKCDSCKWVKKLFSVESLLLLSPIQCLIHVWPVTQNFHFDCLNLQIWLNFFIKDTSFWDLVFKSLSMYSMVNVFRFSSSVHPPAPLRGVEDGWMQHYFLSSGVHPEPLVSSEMSLILFSRILHNLSFGRGNTMFLHWSGTFSYLRLA